MTNEYLIITKNGMGIRARISDFPIQGRGGQGIRAIILRKGDAVAAVIPIEK